QTFNRTRAFALIEYKLYTTSNGVSARSGQCTQVTSQSRSNGVSVPCLRKSQTAPMLAVAMRTDNWPRNSDASMMSSLNFARSFLTSGCAAASVGFGPSSFFLTGAFGVPAGVGVAAPFAVAAALVAA